ncbi:PilX N-terminal domain-containing pilus assembly protein [Gallaecimonas sp. GXIMD1310]|uniref:pilus assembly PilX family protein n=1 Tax=Gallaecimonas sp. GXIMD1310 TaxID=3131926 RepID=UPI0032445F23
MKRTQHGMVLFVALVFLLIITVLGVALLSNSAMDVKMSGAVTDRTNALQTANGVLDDVLLNADTTRAFLQDLGNYAGGFNVNTGLSDSTGAPRQATIQFEVEGPCPRAERGTSAGTFVCRHFRDSSQVNFGRKGLGQLTVTNGISQPLVAPTGS